jgi:hypothetical protein
MGCSSDQKYVYIYIYIYVYMRVNLCLTLYDDGFLLSQITHNTSCCGIL